jgi:DNA-binding NtrC family response regulator
MNDDTLNGPLTLLIVHDNDVDCRFVSKLFLTDFGQAVDTVRNVNQALMRFDASIHDVVITDNFMTGVTGAELAHIIKLRSPATRVVCYSANPPANNVAFDLVVQKSDLQPMLKEALEKLLSAPRPTAQPGNGLWVGSPNYEGRGLKQV